MSVTPAAGFRDISATTMRYIPALYSGKLLVKFYAETVFGEIANTDYTGEIKRYGDTVYIRTVPTLTINTYYKGMVLANEQPESAPVTLSINQGRYWSFVTDDVDDAQTDIKDYTERWTDDAAKQLKINIDTAILAAVYTSAHASNQGNSAGVKSANIALGIAGTPVAVTKSDIIEKIVDCGQVLDEQNVPETGRWMVIPAWMAAMIKKSDLKNASLTGDTTSIARNGRLGEIDRFTLYLSNNLHSAVDSGSGQTCTDVIFGTNHAITFASQLVKNKVQDDPDGFGTRFRGLQVFGYQVVKSEALGWLMCYKST